MNIDIRPLLQREGESQPIELEGKQAITLEDFASYRFPEPVTFHGKIVSETDGIVRIAGILRVVYEGVCDRCLQDVREEMEVPVDEQIYPKGYQADLHRLFPNLSEEELLDNQATDPEEMIFHDNKYVEVDKLFRDQVLLALPIGLYCSEDCPGLCPQCGRRKDDLDCTCENTEFSNSPFDKLKELL